MTILSRLAELARLIAAAPRDNPLVRYGSPARRLSVPRALWWLAMGVALFVAMILCLVEIDPQGSWQNDSYRGSLAYFAMAMPLVAAVCFLGFGFPHREREHLAELELAGMTSRDLMVGFLYWPVVGCLLVVGALGITPWGAALVGLFTTQFSQPVDVFAWRVLSWVALVLWALMCLVIAFRAWSVPGRRGVVVVAATLGALALHGLWLVALQTSVTDFCVYYLGKRGMFGGSSIRAIWVGIQLAWMAHPSAVLIGAVGLLLAVPFELWLTARSTWRLFAKEEQVAPRWLAIDPWPRTHRPSVEATTEWILCAVVAALVAMVATRALSGFGLAQAWRPHYGHPHRTGEYLASGNSYVAVEPGLIVAMVVAVTAMFALYSMRWRLPDDPRARRSVVASLVGLAMLVAFGSLLYAALAEASLAGQIRYFLGDPSTILWLDGSALLRAYVSTTLLVLILPPLVFLSVRACAQHRLASVAWIALATFVVWPARVGMERWREEEPTGIFSWFPYMGRSGLWWFVIAVALCLWIKLRGVREATPPRR